MSNICVCVSNRVFVLVMSCLVVRLYEQLCAWVSKCSFVKVKVNVV